MGDLSVLVCFGYLRGECVPGSSVLYFRKRYDCWLPNTYCIPSAFGMATHQEQLDAAEESAARLEGITSVHMLMTAPNHAKLYRNRQWTCTAVVRFQQYMCKHGCGKKMRSYCACTLEMGVLPMFPRSCPIIGCGGLIDWGIVNLFIFREIF
jgi:hypothetical protein